MGSEKKSLVRALIYFLAEKSGKPKKKNFQEHTFETKRERKGEKKRLEIQIQKHPVILCSPFPLVSTNPYSPMASKANPIPRQPATGTLFKPDQTKSGH